MYAKVFTQILDSSIAEDYTVRLVFEDFLKLADKHGVVDMTPQAISRRTNVPLEIVTRGISTLMQPDPRSRSKEHAGRRIVLLDDHRDWGWLVVNFVSYHNIRTADERSEYMRRYRKERRSAGEEAANSPGINNALTPVNNVNNSVNSVSTALTMLAHADTDTHTDTDTDTDLNTLAQSNEKPLPHAGENGVFELPLLGGSEYQVPQSLFDSLVKAYPGISVMGELSKMHAWLLASPKNRKTARGMAKFINSWCGRAQNSARVVPQPSVAKGSSRYDDPDAAYRIGKVGGGVQ